MVHCNLPKLPGIHNKEQTLSTHNVVGVLYGTSKLVESGCFYVLEFIFWKKRSQIHLFRFAA